MTIAQTNHSSMEVLRHSYSLPIRITEWTAATAEGLWQEAKATWRILLVQSGSGTIGIGTARQAYRASCGMVLLIGPSDDSRLILHEHSSLRGLLMEYRCLYANGEEADGLAHDEPIVTGSSLIQRLAGEIGALWKQSNLGGPYRMQELFASLLTELERACVAATRPVYSWLERTLKIMEEQYSQDLTRERLAKEANVTPEHFSRTFRKATGRSFNEHLTLLRIRHAQLSLLVAPANLNAIAQEVGYREGVYLSRRFKEAVGMSPTAYVKRHKRIAALNMNHTASLVALGIRPELGVYTSWLEEAQSKLQLACGQKYNPYDHTRDYCYEFIAAAQPDLIIHYSDGWENKQLLRCLVCRFVR